MSAHKQLPSLAEIRQLGAHYTTTVPAEWEDRNGHVNVQYYLALYSRGGWRIIEEAGIDEDFLVARSLSIFDLENHLSYLAEMHVGDTVSIYNRMLGRSHKLFHGVLFIVNDTRDRLACTIEYLSLCVDSNTRRSAPFPADMAAPLDGILARHKALDWQTSVRGCVQP